MTRSPPQTGHVLDFTQVLLSCSRLGRVKGLAFMATQSPQEAASSSVRRSRSHTPAQWSSAHSVTGLP